MSTRRPCCEKVGLKKGPWTPKEDKKLIPYVTIQHGHQNWPSLPARAGLQRCGKSCGLRWINYLKPYMKRGNFSLEEDHTIIQLHDLLGNKWSTIATLLPKRTDNDIKNHCNTNNKKDKNVNVIKHMAQWESVRLEAESRLSNLSISSLSNKNNNNAMYNSCSIMLAIDHDDPLSPISKLNFHSIELHVPTNNELCSLSYESDLSDSNMMETTNGEEIMDGYVLQDDDDIMEAFRDHSFNGHTIMEFNGNGKGNLDTSISFLK